MRAAHYRDIIEDAIKEFDDSFDEEIYEAMAWVGLMGKGSPPDPVTGLLPVANTIIWEFSKTNEERLVLLNIIDLFKSSNILPVRTIIILYIWVLGILPESLFTQELSEVNCLIFNLENEFIEMKVNEEIMLTTFSIVRKKYETEESREIAIQQYREKSLTGIPFPTLNFSYTTFNRPEEINTLNEIGCVTISCLELVRENEHLLTYNMLFIQKLTDGRYKKWNVKKWTY